MKSSNKSKQKKEEKKINLLAKIAVKLGICQKTAKK